MIRVPFTKAHGAENDFLLTWAAEIPDHLPLPEVARKVCARTTGIGGDGWMLVWRTGFGLRTQLFNSDGSQAEISGNGTRCAAALGLWAGAVEAPDVQVETAAGKKHLNLIARHDRRFEFEMNMGLPKIEELRATMALAGTDYDATILNVGNPQCAIFVPQIPDSWRIAAAEAERHTRFPNRSNVSVVRVLDRHAIEVVFYERGAGETRSSGTGSTGAAAAAILRGEVESPVEIHTPAGSLKFRWDDSLYLTGPAEIIGDGAFFVDI